jgi:hypothetical protein
VKPPVERKQESYHHQPVPQQQRQRKTEVPIRSPAGGGESDDQTPEEDPDVHVRRYDEVKIQSIVRDWLMKEEQ